MASDKKSGLLGNDILDRFHMYIDFINNHLYLKPNGHYNDSFDISSLGFSFTDRSETLNAWIVTGFFSGSDAEKTGLQIDDRIVTVDDLPITTLDYHTRSDYFDNADSLKLGIEHDGKLKHITVKLAPVLVKE